MLFIRGSQGKKEMASILSDSGYDDESSKKSPAKIPGPCDVILQNDWIFSVFCKRSGPIGKNINIIHTFCTKFNND
jgi:hypothetical protein